MTGGRLGRCPICKPDAPAAPLEEHHIHPLAYGGKRDGKTVWLCGTHHSSIHLQAENLSSGNAVKRYFPDDATLARAKPYIETILRVKRQYLDSGVAAVEGRNLFSMKLEPELKKRLKRRAKDAGMSMETYVVRLIKLDLSQVG
jgi:hypothetical protein